MSRSALRIALIVLAILVPAAVVIYGLLDRNTGQVRPRALAGKLDLSKWDFNGNGPVNLNGEWRFLWEEFSDGNKMQSETETVYAKVPGIWNGLQYGKQKLPAQGYASYMLDVSMPDSVSDYALYLLTVSNAYRLWANDKLIAENGKAGVSESTSVPDYEPKIVVFHPGAKNVRLRMEISNFAHCKGGFWLPVQLGRMEQIQQQRDGRVLLEMFLFGSLFIMAVYHFSLYLLRRSDRSTLYFGLMCTVIGVRGLLTGENLINHIWPDIDWFLARKTEYMLTFLSAPVYVTFSRILYPVEWNKTIYRIVVGFGLALCLFVLFTPSSIYTNTSYVFTAYAWLTSMYTIFVFAKAARNRREGSGIFLGTSLFFLLTIVNDTLNQLEIVHTGLYLSFGLLIVTFAQSFVLSSRFSNAFRMAELYAATFRKFVPGQFLDKIAKDGIGSIKPGNAEKGRATLLFADIRSFTTIAESMTPDEVFGMLNKFLSYVEPPIRAHNGYVDKYMGDGIMALFEDGQGQNAAENAVHASLDMLKALEEFNALRIRENKPVLRMGIGLHTGQVIIGTLGGNERMDSTAIGDAVNLASRVEGMTKMYGVELLISEQTLKLLGQQHPFVCRFADNVAAKGKSEPVAIWQVIARKGEKLPDGFDRLLPAYEAAMDLLKKQEFQQAKEAFMRCAEICPGDELSALYQQRAEEFFRNGAGDGVRKLSGK